MRTFILLGLSAFALTACDTAYGPAPSSASTKSYVTTGSRLPTTADQQPGNVEVLNGGALDHAKNGGGPTKNGPS